MATVGIVGVILAVGLLIIIPWQHCRIAKFFRFITSPPYNNWILLGLWVGVVVLFFTTIMVGGGEPIGLKALRQASERPSDPVVEFYNQSRAINKPPQVYPPVSAPPDSGTWVWWEIFLVWLLTSIAFTFIVGVITVHNKARNVWTWILKRWES